MSCCGVGPLRTGVIPIFQGPFLDSGEKKSLPGIGLIDTVICLQEPEHSSGLPGFWSKCEGKRDTDRVEQQSIIILSRMQFHRGNSEQYLFT